MKVAILLSLESFEGFYEREFGLSLEEYLLSYRNDWSWEYVAGLSKQNIEVVLYLPSITVRGTFVTPEGFQVRFLKIKSWYKLWLKCPWLHRSPIGRYVGQVANGMSFFDDLARSLSDDGIDLLYLQGYWTGRYDYLARHSHIPFIAADHGTSSYRQITWNKSLSLQAACKVTCQTPDELIEVRGYGARTILLPNGVDTNFFCPEPDGTVGANDSDRTILCVTRLKNQPKRITDLLHAMKFLGPEWSLQIAGDGPDRCMLQKLAHDLRIEERVRFLRFVRDRAVLRELYRRCGVFVLCSSSEGVSLSVLEAMSCAASVVVTDIRAFDATIEHLTNGVKVSVGEPENLANAISEAYTRRREFGVMARQTIVESFSQDIVYAGLAANLRECAGKSKSLQKNTLSEKVKNQLENQQSSCQQQRDRCRR